MRYIKYFCLFLILTFFYVFLGPFKTIDFNHTMYGQNMILNNFQQKIYLIRLNLFYNQSLAETLYLLPIYEKNDYSKETSLKVFDISLKKKPDYSLAYNIIQKQTYIPLSNKEEQFLNNFNFNQNLNKEQKLSIYCFGWKTKNDNISIKQFILDNDILLKNSCENYLFNNHGTTSKLNYNYFITSPLLFISIINFLLLIIFLFLKKKNQIYSSIIFSFILINLLFIISNSYYLINLYYLIYHLLGIKPHILYGV